MYPHLVNPGFLGIDETPSGLHIRTPALPSCAYRRPLRDDTKLQNAGYRCPVKEQITSPELYTGWLVIDVAHYPSASVSAIIPVLLYNAKAASQL